MQETTKGNRLHIGIFGRRNAGKSSLINAITKQETALVSDVAGTTTDPVYKAMELLPIGPIMLIDTAGIDDVGDLGKLRIEKTAEVIKKTDIAILVFTEKAEWGDFEAKLLQQLRTKQIPVILALNKCDVSSKTDELLREVYELTGERALAISATTKDGMEELKQKLIALAPENWCGPGFVGDLIEKGDLVVMVVPIDTAAPKGRLILPQVQAIRDVLDNEARALIVKENELAAALDDLKRPPKLIVTDSQVFGKVNTIVPDAIQLTSFSILMARHKGDLRTLVRGAEMVDQLKKGDKILIAEACTHQCQSDDIGRVKIPRWLQQYVGGALDFHWVSGNTFPNDLTSYKLIIHCGACMINRRAMLSRLETAVQNHVPIVNYGVLIAKLHGILPRVLSPFATLRQELKN